ncbi:FAD binding domain-containing protein [Aspergillus germanicus]
MLVNQLQRPQVMREVHAPSFDEETDVLIIGSGAGALTASLRSLKLGLRTIAVEKEKTIWIPCNAVSRKAGIQDSKERALKYFEHAVGDVGPTSSLTKRHAYLDNGPKMVEFLQQEDFELHFSKGYPDYYPALEGAMGKRGGRTIESRAFDTRRIKAAQSRLPPSSVPLSLYTNEAPLFARIMASPRAFLEVVWTALPRIVRSLLGQKLTTLGRGLVAQLLYLNMKCQTNNIRFGTALSKLIQAGDGRVIGAQVQDGNGVYAIRANRGVILAAGGPISIRRTSAPACDTGDAIQEGLRLGAATAVLDDAWWGPTILDPNTSKPVFALMKRARPHCFIVDSTGARFMNEAQSYTDAGHDQYARNEKLSAIPAWLIMDTNHRDKHFLGSLFPRMRPSADAMKSGRIVTAPSVAKLAAKIGVDSDRLCRTAERFNGMCQRGVDDDFRKGDSAYDRFFGDPSIRPKPNLGHLDKPPYYAVQIWPGDLGTKGGLLTDKFQRVLNREMQLITGLYAIGNTASSIMGRTYLGAGSTLGPAMTHGYIAASHMSKSD